MPGAPAAARRFFRRVLSTLKVTPVEVVTDAAPAYFDALDELVPSAWHHVERYANNPIEADHSQLKHRLKPMRGLRNDRTAQTIIAGHAFVQNLRCGHYELGLGDPPARRGRRSVHRTRPSDLTADPTQVQHAHRSDSATAPALVIRLSDARLVKRGRAGLR
ncbi:DDE-type integrase/transposase/recombinase [Polymorphospora rubra]|uniref:DDE-type integrase/transposase/recombinase n=1 Tax=Polymorphospora rubra TaxID=338584 RepID=UPI0033F9096B